MCFISFLLSSIFFVKSPIILGVNLHLAAAIFETTCQLLVLAFLHLHSIEHLSITHQVLVNLTHEGELSNANLSRIFEIFYS